MRSHEPEPVGSGIDIVDYFLLSGIFVDNGLFAQGINSPLGSERDTRRGYAFSLPYW